MPTSQITSEEVGQIADIPVSQQDSMPEKQLMKATYYIWPEQDIKLETIRLARRRKGDKVDKSALIREAIEKLAE